MVTYVKEFYRTFFLGTLGPGGHPGAPRCRLLPDPRDVAPSVASVTSSRSSPSLTLQRLSTADSEKRRRSTAGSTLETPEMRLAEIQEDQGPGDGILMVHLEMEVG